MGICIFCFFDCVGKSLLDHSYNQIESLELEECEIFLYAKQKKKKELNLFVIIKSNVLTECIIQSSNDFITSVLIEKFNRNINKIANSINVISLFCVNRVSNEFNSLFSEGVEQGIRNGRFIAGISFGKNGLYISQANSNFLILK